MFLKLFAFLPFMLMAGTMNAASGDTLNVKAFEKETIVTDPAKGQNSYRKWAVFPKENIPIRQIVMKVTMGCPDSMRCADWDYMDRISLRRRGGLKGKDENYELGRMLTPYGGAFSKNWNFTWQVDVSDFAMLLRDSVEIEYTHNGYEPNNDRGWAVTVEFQLMKGQPHRVPVSIQKLYDGTFPYGDSSKPITGYLTPVAFSKAEGADFGVIRIVQTGHGMDRPDGCAEFCNKYRDVFVDGELLGRKSMWKKCGDNPLYPQAGTWPLDRANWCPGDLVAPDLYYLPHLKDKHSFLLSMEEYTATAPQATEVISAYLIQYKTGKKKNLVSLEEVVSPNDNELYARHNPASFGPAIVVKNREQSSIYSLDISYGTKGFPKSMFRWTGAIGAFDTARIILPGVIRADEGQNTFEVSIERINGKKDSYDSDNRLQTTFTKAPVLDSVIVLKLLTNKNAGENAYVLQNAESEQLYARKLGELKPETEYVDTFQLAPGAYQFLLKDTAGNGLEFWFASRAGRGLAYLLNRQGKMVKSFESDFGNFSAYSFYVGAPVSALPGDEFQIGLFPTRTVNSTTLDYFANDPEDVVVRLVSDPGGEVLEEHHYKKLKSGLFTYDLSHYKPGRFYIKVFVNGQEKFIKRVRYKE